MWFIWLREFVCFLLFNLGDPKWPHLPSPSIEPMVHPDGMVQFFTLMGVHFLVEKCQAIERSTNSQTQSGTTHLQGAFYMCRFGWGRLLYPWDWQLRFPASLVVHFIFAHRENWGWRPWTFWNDLDHNFLTNWEYFHHFTRNNIVKLY